MRQLFAAIVLSALAVAAIAGAIGSAAAADLPEQTAQAPKPACAPKEEVVLFNDWGAPTPPARTPYYTCITGTTLLPGDIPPPPEYCCS